MSLTSGELIRRWRERRKEILRTLRKDLLAEFIHLGKQIAAVRQEEAKTEQQATSPPRTGFLGPLPSSSRVSMAVHKFRLVEFLKQHGPSTRKEITTKTGIPEGSLSELLKRPIFEKQRWGIWALKDQVKKPGTSAEPQSNEPT
jgi:hypothetical protein